MKETAINARNVDIEKGVRFVERILIQKRVPKEKLAKTLLLVEDALAHMVDCSINKDEKLRITVSVWLGEVRIHMSGRGSRGVDLSAIKRSFDYSEYVDPMDAEKMAIIRQVYNRIAGRSLSASYKDNINSIDIKETISRNRQLLYTFAALILGVGFGFLAKLVLPTEAALFLATEPLDFFTQLFLQALKLVLAPLVFFSIASSVVNLDDFKSLGRIATKILFCYLATSVIATVLGFCVYALLPIGDSSLASGLVPATAAASEAIGDVTLKGTLLGIVPSNIVAPFLQSNMLQIIFVALLLGLTSATLSREHPGLKQAILSANALFSKVTGLIVATMPIMIFCSMAKMVIEIKEQDFLKVFSFIPVMYFACFIMLLVYALFLLIFAHLNPIKFFKAYFQAMLTAFTSCSSNATLPVSLRLCKEKLGIGEKIYSFSIPLGATINMDGGCLLISIGICFLAKVFGIPMDIDMLISLGFSILILTMGAPGIPGANLICMTMLLPQAGIPIEGINLVVGIYSLLCMALTCVNVTGDAVSTLIVAKTERAIDLEKFNEQ